MMETLNMSLRPYCCLATARRKGSNLHVFKQRDCRAPKDRARNDKSLLLLMLFMAFHVSTAQAQEISVQGWGVSESKQNASGTVSRTPMEGLQGPVRVSSGILIPATDHGGSRAPFPVLTPKAIVYPRKAIRKGWEGQTVVAAEILPDGSVGRTALAKTSGHEVLDQAAREAIKDWKFGTESEQHEAVPQYVDIPVTFKLKDQGEG